MSALTNIPENKNFLSPLGFAFLIKKTPNVNYFVQSAVLPNIILGQADIQTPFVKLPIPGDHIDFGQLQVTFRIDEEMRNYKEIFDWIVALGFPENFNQYRAIAPQRGAIGGPVTQGTGTGVYSDGSLLILNSVKNPIIEFSFKEMYPVSLTDISFDTKLSSVDYLDVTATFAYRNFTLTYL